MPGIYSPLDGIIGVQSALGGRGGGPRYLLRDEFTTDRAAGAVNGTAAEPGPGTRVVYDPLGKVTISSDKVQVATGATGTDLPVIWDNVAITRVPGRILTAKVSWTTGAYAGFGYSSAPSYGSTWVIARQGSSGEVWLLGGVNYVIGISPPAQTSVLYALRATGLFLFANNGSGWRLLGINTIAYLHSTSPVYLQLNVPFDSYSAVSFDYARVPEAIWLPTPLLSDGFGSAFGVSDGLGHAEGVAGGIGAGGSGVALSNAGGTWSVSGGKAINTAPSGLVQELGIANLFCSDVHAGASVVRALSNEVGLALCWDSDSSPANGLIIHSDGAGNIKVDKYVAGVKTNVSTTAFTYFAGARLVATMNAGALRTYYNGSLVKADTIVDAAILTGTYHGAYSNGGASTLDDLVIYATGTDGEHSQLDNY